MGGSTRSSWRIKMKAHWPWLTVLFAVAALSVLQIWLWAVPLAVVGVRAGLLLGLFAAFRWKAIFIIILTGWALLSVSFVFAHISDVAANAQPGWFEWSVDNLCKPCADWVLNQLGFDRKKLDDASYSKLTADMIAVCAFTFAVWPVLLAFYVARRLENQAGVKNIPVKSDYQAQATMFKYFKGADEITIFCGSFDWIGDHPKLKDQLVGLARASRGAGRKYTDRGRKLRLVSFRDKEAVREAFQSKRRIEIFRELEDCFWFSSPLGEGVKCSVVRKKRGRNVTFLYMWQPDGEPTSNASVRTGGGETRELMEILDNFANSQKWGKREDSPVASRGAATPATDEDDEEEEGSA